MHACCACAKRKGTIVGQDAIYWSMHGSYMDACMQQGMKELNKEASREMRCCMYERNKQALNVLCMGVQHEGHKQASMSWLFASESMKEKEIEPSPHTCINWPNRKIAVLGRAMY